MLLFDEIDLLNNTTHMKIVIFFLFF